jgi:hypothetical protein
MQKGNYNTSYISSPMPTERRKAKVEVKVEGLEAERIE